MMQMTIHHCQSFFTNCKVLIQTILISSLYIHRTTSGDSSGSDDETASSSESDLSTDEDEDSAEDGIPVSATQGDGVDLLWDRVQEKVLQATGNKHIVFAVPTDGPQLRYVNLVTFSGWSFIKSLIKHFNSFCLVGYIRMLP